MKKLEQLRQSFKMLISLGISNLEEFIPIEKTHQQRKRGGRGTCSSHATFFSSVLPSDGLNLCVANPQLYRRKREKAAGIRLARAWVKLQMLSGLEYTHGT